MVFVEYPKKTELHVFAFIYCTFYLIYFTFVYSGLIEVRYFFGKNDLTNSISKTKYAVLYCPQRLRKQHKIEPHLSTESTEEDLHRSNRAPEGINKRARLLSSSPLLRAESRKASLH